ncbi:MAG TPA: hypothetical protein VII42_04305, partial [Caulobacteraceae bacterium]
MTLEAIRAATRPDDGALEPASTMEHAPSRLASTTHPTRLSSMVFAAKAIVFRLRRLAADLRAPPPRLATGGADLSRPA